MIDSPPTNKKESHFLSEIIIRPNTPREEYDYLWESLETAIFFKEHGYTLELPDHPTYQELARIAPNFESIDKVALFETFTNEIYDIGFYKAGLANLESMRPRIEQALPIFKQLNEAWGFKTFPKYQVCVTRYGTGGSYSTKDGTVTMMTRADGTFMRQDVGEAVIHEILHIGVEELIVQKFGLTHWEKERMIDKICTKGDFVSIMPNYNLQHQGDMRVDSYISDNLTDSLPSSIQRYVIDFPR